MMSDQADLHALSSYGHLAAGYLVFVASMRGHVKRKLQDRYGDHEKDGWWTGAVKAVLDVQHKDQRESRWDTIQRLHDQRPELAPEDFLDPSHLRAIVQKYHDDIAPMDDALSFSLAYRDTLFDAVGKWRNQYFAHPPSSPPSAEQVQGLLRPAQFLLASFELHDAEAQIRRISDLVAAQPPSFAQQDHATTRNATSDSRVVDDRSTVATVVINGLNMFGEGRQTRLPVVREYASYLQAEFNDLIPRDVDLLDVLLNDDRLVVHRDTGDLENAAKVWVSLSNAAETSTPDAPPPPTALTPAHDAVDRLSATDDTKAADDADLWLPRVSDAIRKVCYPDGWAPISWCELALRDMHEEAFPGAGAGTGAVGAFVAAHPELFELVGGADSGKVRLRQEREHDGIAAAIQQAIGSCEENDGWSPIIRVTHYLTMRRPDVNTHLEKQGLALVEWLRVASRQYELETRAGIPYVRPAGEQVNAGASPNETETATSDVGTNSPYPPLTQGSGEGAGRLAGISTPHMVSHTQRTPSTDESGKREADVRADDEQLADWTALVREACENSADDGGWARLAVIGDYLHKQHRGFKPQSYGSSGLGKLIAQRPDLFEIEDRPRGSKSAVRYIRLAHDKAS